MSGECGDASIAQDLSFQSCVGDYRASVEVDAVTILNLPQQTTMQIASVMELTSFWPTDVI